VVVIVHLLLGERGSHGESNGFIPKRGKKAHIEVVYRGW
jgi:hypothetical protein